MHRKVTIAEKRDETRAITTFMFRDDKPALPGQFVMVWVPGRDEIPMSLSYTGDMKGITVNRVGEATDALCALKKGDTLAIRGPYGTAFSFDKAKRVLAVGGGVGMAPLAPAIEKARMGGAKVTTVIGARTKDDLLFIDRVKKASDVIISTDDGSAGRHGFATDAAESLLAATAKNASRMPDHIITCGPEIMMSKVFTLAAKYRLPAQASIERHMKCAAGICDSCAIGGLLVCRDGPIFNREQLVGTDFGKCWRDASGRKIPVR